MEIAVKELSSRCLFFDLCGPYYRLVAAQWHAGVGYCTSKMCHKCQHADCEVHKAKLKDEKKAVPCYHVLHCTKCQVFMQRDVNASLNILLLTRYELEGRARPAFLSRDAH